MKFIQVVFFLLFFYKGNCQLFGNIIDENIWNQSFLAKNKIKAIKLIGIDINNDQKNIFETNFKKDGLKSFSCSYYIKKSELLFSTDTIFFNKTFQSQYDCSEINADEFVKRICDRNNKIIYGNIGNTIYINEYGNKSLLIKKYVNEGNEGRRFHSMTKYQYGKNGKILAIKEFKENTLINCAYNDTSHLEDRCYTLSSETKIYYSSNSNIQVVDIFEMKNGKKIILSNYKFVYNKKDLLKSIRLENFKEGNFNEFLVDYKFWK